MVYYVICSGAGVAEWLARSIRLGELSNTYPTHADVLHAWETQPLPMQIRYVPYAVEIEPGHFGSCAATTKRLRTEAH